MEGKYTECAAIMNDELKVLNRLAENQTKVRAALEAKNWTDFAALQDAAKTCGGELEALEKKRAALFGSPEMRFYTFIAGLEGAERDTLAVLYRELKTLSAKIRFENDAVAEYVKEQSALVMLFLEAAFPEKRGKIYSRSGTAKAADMRSLVLDKSL